MSSSGIDESGSADGGGHRAPDRVKLDYPKAEPSPKTFTFGKVSFDDPYHWLEEATEQVLEWQTAQDALTTAYLASLPGYARFGERVARLASSQDVMAPKYGGGRWFRQWLPDGEELPVIEMADSPAGAGRRIVDLNAMRTGDPLRISFYSPSPDGRKLAFSWSAGGLEFDNLQVIDVDTGERLLEGVPQKGAGDTAWLPDRQRLLL